MRVTFRVFGKLCHIDGERITCRDSGLRRILEGRLLVIKSNYPLTHRPDLEEFYADELIKAFGGEIVDSEELGDTMPGEIY